MRLIDADELIEFVRLQQQDALDGATVTNKTIFKQKVVDCKNFIELTQEMPTAYNLGVVAKKLEEEYSALTNAMSELYDKMYSDKEALDRIRLLSAKRHSIFEAIEIVKEGVTWQKDLE